MCSFRLELCFAPNELFEDGALWLHVSWRGGDTVACAGSGVRWKPGKCLTARQRDVAVAGGAAKYRPSLFLLFEPTAGDQGSSGGKGLMDPHEKLAIARALRFARAPAHARAHARAALPSGCGRGQACDAGGARAGQGRGGRAGGEPVCGAAGQRRRGGAANRRGGGRRSQGGHGRGGPGAARLSRARGAHAGG